MANIFRSKEVYKKPPKSLHGKDEMIPVRGVYVSGEYRPPYYDENGVMITEISSKKPTIVNYTSEYHDTTATNATGLLDFRFDSELQIQVYSTEYKDATPTNAFGLLDFRFDTELQLDVYGKDYIDTPSTNATGLLDFQFSTILQAQMLNKNSYNNAPEPCLRLATIQTQPAVISNYIP